MSHLAITRKLSPEVNENSCRDPQLDNLHRWKTLRDSTLNEMPSSISSPPFSGNWAEKEVKKLYEPMGMGDSKETECSTQNRTDFWTHWDVASCIWPAKIQTSWVPVPKWESKNDSHPERRGYLQLTNTLKGKLCFSNGVSICLLQTTLRSGHLSRFGWSTQMNSKVLEEIILIYYLFVCLTFWLLTLFCRILLAIYLCIKLSNFEFVWVFLLFLFLCVFASDTLP